MRAKRRDGNESAILAPLKALNGFWIQAPPFDGWLWNGRFWHLCEVKRPSKEGWKDEFTAEQKKLIVRLNERRVPYNILRTEADVLALMGARRSA